MSRSTDYRRGSEAPMDFEYTNRPNVKPIWAQGPNDTAAGSSSPRKRPHDLTTPHTPFTPDPPRFGFNTGQNVPFIFASPPPPPPPSTGWAPPQDFSPAKSFPDLQDVDMLDASPPKPVAEDSTRAVALGGLKRVFKRREQRRKAAERTHDATDDSESDAEDNDEKEGSGLIRRRPIQKTTSHHYTLNMPSAAPPRSELPALLLGYLQFFFNLSLVLLFLYLLLQFILMVQRDVEQKISEYSLDILQEISTCTTHYEKNDCGGNPGPWVAQQCPVWEQCMARDPTKIGRTRVSAELIAETVNSLVDPISWKALAFTLTSLAFLTLFINSLFTLFRGRLAPPTAPIHIPTPIAPGPGFPMLSSYPTHSPSPWSQWRPEESEEAPRLRRRLEDGVEKKGR